MSLFPKINKCPNFKIQSTVGGILRIYAFLIGYK